MLSSPRRTSFTLQAAAVLLPLDAHEEIPSASAKLRVPELLPGFLKPKRGGIKPREQNGPSKSSGMSELDSAHIVSTKGRVRVAQLVVPEHSEIPLAVHRNPPEVTLTPSSTQTSASYIGSRYIELRHMPTRSDTSPLFSPRPRSHEGRPVGHLTRKKKEQRKHAARLT